MALRNLPIPPWRWITSIARGTRRRISKPTRSIGVEYSGKTLRVCLYVEEVMQRKDDMRHTVVPQEDDQWTKTCTFRMLLSLLYRAPQIYFLHVLALDRVGEDLTSRFG